MRPELPARLVGFAKFLAVVVLGLGVGVGGGYGLGKLGSNDASGADDTSATALTTTSGDTTAASARTSTTSTTEKPAPTAPKAAAGTLKVTVLSAKFKPATTVSGRKRKRARLTMRLSVRNTAKRTSTLGSAFIAFARNHVKRDPNATRAAAALGNPIKAGKAANGELRFETVGSTTTRLKAAKSARLRVNGQTLTFTITR
jgi:hypothetical protein